MTDDIIDQPDIETAAERADAYTLFGKPLEPYTPQRAAAALRMGMVYPNVPAKDWIPAGQAIDRETGEPFTVSVWPQLFEDSIIVCYLCSIPPRDVRRAFRDPESLLDAAMDWAQVNHVMPTSDAAKEVAGVFTQILGDVKATKHKLKSMDDDGGSPEPSDPN